MTIFSSFIGPASAPHPRGRFSGRIASRYRENRRAIALGVLVIMTAAVLLAPRMIVTVPAGHYGVMWLRFSGGTVTSYALGEGFHLILPWNYVFVYDGRLQAEKKSYDAVTRDGLLIEVDVTFRWRVMRSTVGYLHRDIGPSYGLSLLTPEIGSTARDTISRYSAEELIAGQRSEVQEAIFRNVAGRPAMVARQIGPSDRPDTYVALQDILISSLVLPTAVRDAIQRKLEQAEIADEYKYRIVRERLESERKGIEAEGIRNFQQIVQSGISPTYLAWRGIEATLELARSPNAKTVVIGGSNGLPLILNTGDDARPMQVAGPGAAEAKPPAVLPVEPPARGP